MANVTGTLKDFGLAVLAPFNPVIYFVPSGPGVASKDLLSSRRLPVTPASNGDFTANLQPTADVRPERWYTIEIWWRDTAGNYISKDFLDWKLFVPVAGGQLSDLIQAPSNPSHVWIGLTSPPNPTPGTWWLEADPDNPTWPANTGTLYEWS